jgi:hypothetical protein
MRKPESRAIAIIAAHAIHYATFPEWEDYPEIGEGDWLKVLAEIDTLTLKPALADFNLAYDVLKARAEH